MIGVANALDGYIAPIPGRDSWGSVKIADASHLLLVAAEVVGGLTDGDPWPALIE
jgi:hypothetical protein